MKAKKETKTKFVKVRCNKCKNEQNIYSAVTTKTVCLVCEEVLAEPTGGKSRIHAKQLEILSS
ncbi:MAG TPA: 30S ribosomal protein S27e [Candidatus Nanoarchaeia archaeon]|nr:30S ribosomal protein S27e [Candidatus Nanoarchaeia archaeon]